MSRDATAPNSFMESRGEVEVKHVMRSCNHIDMSAHARTHLDTRAASLTCMRVYMRTHMYLCDILQGPDIVLLWHLTDNAHVHTARAGKKIPGDLTCLRCNCCGVGFWNACPEIPTPRKQMGRMFALVWPNSPNRAPICPQRFITCGTKCLRTCTHPSSRTLVPYLFPKSGLNDQMRIEWRPDQDTRPSCIQKDKNNKTK